MAVKLGRIEREIVEIADAVDRRADAAEAVSQRTKEPVA
jgi:hypothetical protein